MSHLPRSRRRAAVAALTVGALATLGAVVLARGAEAADTIVALRPVADTYANAGAPSTTYGTAWALASRGTPGAVAYLRFSLPSAPSGQRLDHARLVLTTATDTPASSAEAHHVGLAADTWSESTLNWNTHPAPDSVVLGTLESAPELGTAYSVPLDVSTLAGVLGRSTTLTITGTGSDSLYFWSANQSRVAARPLLELGFVDVAAASTPAASTADEPPGVVTARVVDALTPAGSPPTTRWTMGLTSTLTDGVRIAPTDHRLAYRGAKGFAYGTGGEDGNVWAPSSKYPYTWNTQPNWTVEFVTDAPTVELVYKQRNASHYRLSIDGRPVTETTQPLPFASAGRTAVLRFDFATTATRRLAIDLYSAKFVGINLPSGAALSAPPAARTRWAVLGDSLTGGSNQNTGFGQGTWMERAARLLGWDDPYNQASGGTGYVVPGQSVKFGDRLDGDIIAAAPEKVVLFGGYNDVLVDKTQLAAEASALMARLRVGLPSAAVYVVGCWSPRGVPATPWVDTNNVLEKVAREGHASFISVLDGRIVDADGTELASEGSWITGSGKVGATTGTGNADRFIGTDGVHPTDAGHAYLGRRLAQALALLTPDTTLPATVELTWPAATGALGYDVHRSTTAGFTPGATTLVATTDTTRWVDTPGARGAYHYVVVPRLTSGVGASRVSSAVVLDVVGSFPTDVTPPARPEALKAVASSTGVAVTWTSSSDDVGPVLYEVHRSAKNSFTPGPTTILGLTAAPSYTDVAGTSGATYAVVAVDAAGNRSQLATTIAGLG